MWEDNNHDGARMAAVGAVIFLSAALILALNARAGAPPPLFPPSPTGRLQAHGPGVLRAVTVDPFPSDVTVDEQTDRVFVVTGSTITVLDGRTGALVRTINQEDARPVTVATGAGTGRLFVVNSAIAGSSYPGGPGYHNPDGSVDVLDARTLRLIHSVRIAPGPRTAAVDARRGRIYILGSYTDAQDSGAPDPTSPGSVTVLDERSGRVFVGNLRGLNTISMIDAATGAVLHTVHDGFDHVTLRVDDVTGRILAYPSDGTDNGYAALVLDGYTGVTRGAVALTGDIVAISPRTGHWLVAPPGPSVFTLDTAPGRLVVLDNRSGKILRSVTFGQPSGSLQIVGDARTGRVFVGDQGNQTVTILDATRL